MSCLELHSSLYMHQEFWTSCCIARHCGSAGSEKCASTCSVAILDYIEWLGFSDLSRKETILLSRSNFYTCRNIENTVGLRQAGIKSLFGRHLCLFQAVSRDVFNIPFAFTIEFETRVQKLQ